VRTRTVGSLLQPRCADESGGEHWAVVASLIETCKMDLIDPYANLRDVITKIVAGIR
jgi:hypothetical protein